METYSEPIDSGQMVTQRPIFDANDFELLKRTEREIHESFAVMDKASSCGVKCDAYRHKMQQILEDLQHIRIHFMKELK